MASDGSELLLEQEENSADSSQDPLDSSSVAETAGVSRRRTRSATRGPREYKAKKTPKPVRDTVASAAVAAVLAPSTVPAAQAALAPDVEIGGSEEAGAHLIGAGQSSTEAPSTSRHKDPTKMGLGHGCPLLPPGDRIRAVLAAAEVAAHAEAMAVAVPGKTRTRTPASVQKTGFGFGGNI